MDLNTDMLVFSVKAVQITSYMVNGTVRVWVLWLMMFRCFIMFFMFIMFLSIILSDSQISDSCSALFIAHVSFTCWGVGRCNSCKLTSKKRLGKKKIKHRFQISLPPRRVRIRRVRHHGSGPGSGSEVRGGWACIYWLWRGSVWFQSVWVAS